MFGLRGGGVFSSCSIMPPQGSIMPPEGRKMKKWINRSQMSLLNYLISGKWHSDHSTYFQTYLFLSEKSWASEAPDNSLDTNDDAKTYPKRPQTLLKNVNSKCSSTFSSHRIIIHDHHRWSSYIWWSYMMIVYDDRIWWSYMMFVYDDRIRCSYMMLVCDDRIWCSYMPIVYYDYRRS
jgi:hypothetical protein